MQGAWVPSLVRESYLAYLEEHNHLTTVFWSGLPFEGELARELLSYETEQADYYCRMLPMLSAWMESEKLRQTCPDFVKTFSNLLEAEAAVVSELYQQTCAIHLPSADDQWAGRLQSMTAELTAQESHRIADKTSRDASLADLRVALRAAKAELETQYSRLKPYLNTP